MNLDKDPREASSDSPEPYSNAPATPAKADETFIEGFRRRVRQNRMKRVLRF